MNYCLLSHSLKKKEKKKDFEPFVSFFLNVLVKLAERPKQNNFLPFSGEGYKLLN